MSFSDFSDLTELSSDDGDFNPKGGTQKKKQTSSYVLRNALRPPRTVQYSAKYLYEQIVENHIDLNPEYQRDIVWPEPKQSALIDSVLRNYYVPPVIFSVTSQNDGSETRTCIDGKQRLTSIQRFFDGMICRLFPLTYLDKDSFTNQRLWYKGIRGANRKLLPTQYMSLFANKQIVCVEYENLTDDQEREMFQRVQLGVALTPAERLQAITGPFPTLIREIQNMIASHDGFDKNMDWATTRGRDFQSIASVVYIIHKIPAQSFPAATALDKWLQQIAPVDPSLRIAVTETFKKFISLVRNPKLNSPFNKPTRVSPLEFVMIGLLIFILRTKSTDEEISRCIQEMRNDVRSKHTDIRSNTKVTKTMFAFINNYVHNGVGVKPRAVPKKDKRKRVDSSDGDCDDEHNPFGSKPSKPSTSTSRAKRAALSPPSNTGSQALQKTASRNISSNNSKTTSSGNKTSATSNTTPAISTTASVKQESGSTEPVAATAVSTTLGALPSIRNSRAQLSQSLSGSQSHPSKPSRTTLTSSVDPPAPSTSTSRPVGDVKIESVKSELPSDFFAAIRQAKAATAKASTGNLTITSSLQPVPLTPVVEPTVAEKPPDPPGVQTTFIAPPPPNDTSISIDSTVTTGSRSSDLMPIPNAQNLTSENIKRLRNLTMTGVIQVSQVPNSPATIQTPPTPQFQMPVNNVDSQLTCFTAPYPPAMLGQQTLPVPGYLPIPQPPPPLEQRPPVLPPPPPQYIPPPLADLPRRPSSTSGVSQPRYNDSRFYPRPSGRDDQRSRDPRYGSGYYGGRDRDRGWRR